MRHRGRVTDERGVATVMVVLSIPFILLFCVLAIDVANWFVHKRHLQTQADAAALAGAVAYSFPNCDDTLITDAAKRYSGKGDAVATYNPPTDVKTPQSRLFAEINQPTYHGQSTPPDADLPGSPCNKLFLDVKMTETDVPLVFASNFLPVPHINAQARVQLFKATQDAGLRPIGVPDATPRQVRAFVVDEDTGIQVPGASVILTSHGASGGLAQFRNDTPLSFAVPAGTSSNLGVRLALSGSDTSTSCATPPVPLVSCYDSAVTTHGVSFIRTWAGSPDPAADQIPVARSVNLGPGSCGNASFTSSTTSCTFDINAKVKWNPSVSAADLAPATSKTKLTAQYNGNSYPLTYDTTTSTWKATGITLPAGTIGPRTVDIDWEQQVGTVAGSSCKVNGNSKNCKGTFTNVQRTFWNNPDDQASRAGPVATLDVLDTNTTQQVSDLQRCSTCTANLEFDVGIKGSLAIGAKTDPPVALRVDGNQSQSLQCDPAEGGANGLEDMLANGCAPRYRNNAGEACPNRTTLWSSSQPWPCVAILTGQSPNSTPRGLNRRILCNPTIDGAAGTANCNSNGSATACTHPNHWPNFTPDDPRIIDVFLTPFGTFTGTGNDDTVPVVGIGRFYVTGYTAQGVKTPCAEAPSVDQYSINPPPAGNISGHFIVGVVPNTGGVGSETCDPLRVGICTPVLVK